MRHCSKRLLALGLLLAPGSQAQIAVPAAGPVETQDVLTAVSPPLRPGDLQPWISTLFEPSGWELGAWSQAFQESAHTPGLYALPWTEAARFFVLETRSASDPALNHYYLFDNQQDSAWLAFGLWQIEPGTQRADGILRLAPILGNPALAASSRLAAMPYVPGGASAGEEAAEGSRQTQAPAAVAPASGAGSAERTGGRAAFTALQGQTPSRNGGGAGSNNGGIGNGGGIGSSSGIGGNGSGDGSGSSGGSSGSNAAPPAAPQPGSGSAGAAPMPPLPSESGAAPGSSGTPSSGSPAGPSPEFSFPSPPPPLPAPGMPPFQGGDPGQGDESGDPPGDAQRDIVAISEPGIVGLLGAGLAILLGFSRRLRKKLTRG